MNDTMDYDPDKSPYAPSVEEVQAEVKALFKMFGGKEHLKKEAATIPGVSQFALQANSASEAFDQIVARLSISYGTLVRDVKGFEAYGEEVLGPIISGDTTAIDELKSRELPAPFNSGMAFLLASTESIVEGVRAEKQGNTSVAWCHVANAMYNLGKYEATFFVEPMTRELHRRNGRKAAGSKVGNEELIELAKKLASEGNYRSRQLAADAIAPQVEAEATRIGYSWRAEMPATAIYRWLVGFRPKR